MSAKLHDLPEESLALAEDPGRARFYTDQPEQPPVLRLSRQERESFSPMLLILGALIMLGVIIGMVLGTIENANLEQPPSAAPVASLYCNVIAAKDVNVRIGPGYDYPRAWILGVGEARIAVARTNDGWLQVPNGWLPAAELKLQADHACDSLDMPTRIPLFDDDLVQPEAVLALNWHEVLEEGFVTPANNWRDITTNTPLIPQEGALILAAGMQVAPEAMTPLQDAYYAVRGEWVVNEPEAALVLQFRTTEAGAYAILLGIDGRLVITLNGQVLTTGEPVTLQPGMAFTLGVLNHGRKISLYVNNEPRLTIEDTTLTDGLYSFHLQGSGAVLRLERFELSTPLTDF